jgi:hypothetical protein
LTKPKLDANKFLIFFAPHERQLERRTQPILTNCFRTGPKQQNRGNAPDFYRRLSGRIAHMAMFNPARGEKLRSIFARIEWDDPLTRVVEDDRAACPE